MLNDSVNYMLDVIQKIHAHDRWYNDSESKKTTALVEDLMRSLGMEQVETLRFPSDGVVNHGGWVMPLCWDARSGILERLLPDGTTEQICSYEDTPCSLMLYSHPADVVAELALPDAEDVRGKIILFRHKNVSIKEVLEYLDRGAVGFLSAILGGSHYGKEGFEYLEDVTQWCNYRLPLWDVPQKSFGFSLTPRKGKYLEELVLVGETVRLHAKVDTSMAPGTIPFVTGVLPGESKEEILLTGHLFEEGANDNASGVAESLAIVRALAGKKRKRSIRLTFTNEARSYQAYLNNVKEIPPVTAGINVDMVGLNLDNRGWIVDTDAYLPNFAVCLLENCLEKQGLTAGILHYPDNDVGLSDPAFGVPMTLVEFVNDPNYHKSSDTPDKISREFISKTFKAVYEFTEFLVNAGGAETETLAELVCRYEKDPAHFTGKESPRCAIARAHQRLDSILRLVSPEEKEKAAAVLEKYKASFGAVPPMPAPGFDPALLTPGYPQRLYKALFSFERYVGREKDFPEIASLLTGWVAVRWVQYAMMWADGTRTWAEILQMLHEAGFDIDPVLFNAVLKFMTDEGYARILSEKRN